MTLARTFSLLRQRREKALIAYLTAGFPSLETWISNLKIMEQSGADVLEIGVPFSDPIADGPVIQAASQASLRNGTTLAVILEQLRAVSFQKPLVLMSYLNPLLAMGPDRIFPCLKSAGITGLIVPDLPVEESAAFRRDSKKNGIDLVFLASPASPEQRLRKIAGASAGFVYAVSVKGVTGVREGLPAGIEDFMKALRRVTNKPIAVGFGISTPEQVRRFGNLADGVIIGSHFLQILMNRQNLAAAVRALKQATIPPGSSGRSISDVAVRFSIDRGSPDARADGESPPAVSASGQE
ncbi:tryptophan synthase subunit alpha [bacterium]|nr:tryptophan synthase subunit alpha [bacterium]